MFFFKFNLFVLFYVIVSLDKKKYVFVAKTMAETSILINPV